MANRSLSSPVDGESRVGASSPSQQGVLVIESNRPSLGSVLCLQAVAANGTITDVYFWAGSDGKLRTGTTFPTDTETGTVVGTQA